MYLVRGSDNEGYGISGSTGALRAGKITYQPLGMFTTSIWDFKPEIVPTSPCAGSRGYGKSGNTSERFQAVRGLCEKVYLEGHKGYANVVSLVRHTPWKGCTAYLNRDYIGFRDKG